MDESEQSEQALVSLKAGNDPLRSRLKQIAAVLGVPIESFFEPPEAEIEHTAAVEPEREPSDGD